MSDDIVCPHLRLVGGEHESQLCVQLLCLGADFPLAVIEQSVGKDHHKHADHQYGHKIGREMVRVGNRLHVLFLGKHREADG